MAPLFLSLFDEKTVHFRETRSNVMNIIYNGEPRVVTDAITVAKLLVEFNLTPRFVAVEVNQELAPRVGHEDHVLHDGDQVEIVTLVGGG